MDGFSIDFQSSQNSVKIISSAYVGHTTYRGGTGSNLVRVGGVMLRGGRFRRKFGIVTLGTTYATIYGVQGNRQRGAEWRGTVINNTPTPIMVAVRFIDDSPEDGEGGPIVYDIRLKVNERYRDDVVPQVILDDVTLDRTTALTDKLEFGYVEPTSIVGHGAPEYDFLSINETLPKYADYFYYNNTIKGYNSGTIEGKFDRELADTYYKLVEFNDKPIAVKGTEAAVFLFDLASIGSKINRIEAVTKVANDYRIQTSMIYTDEARGGHDPSGKEKSWYDATYWRTAAQCEGNIKDGSNVKTIRIDFGYQVASVMWGVDMDMNYYGFKIRGEYVTNTTGYMFADGNPSSSHPKDIIAGQPPRTGHRFAERDNAYYLTVDKQWDKIGFSGEIFHMGKFYRPYLDYFYPIGRGDSDIDVRNNTMRVPFIEDNDDNDLYPDTMLVQRTMGFRILASEDPDGVFPGNDEDNDGIPDNNRNNNNKPDYDEPFLMFDVDPEEFVFGNDYNNNTIPDFREDDMKMDTPYDLKRRGYHCFVRVSPMKNLDLIAGTFRTNDVVLPKRTNDSYGKMILHYDAYDVGKFYAEYRFEKIQDNIRDPYIQVERTMIEEYTEPGIGSTIGRFRRDLYYDELEYRNSRVNRFFSDSRIRAVPSITLENHIKYERNAQTEGVMYDNTYQPHDILTTIAMVNKIVYTKQWGDFVFSPGVKFRFYKKVRSESLQPLDHYLMRIPLVLFKYIISDRTELSLGLQGIPGIGLEYNDYIQPRNDYRKKTYMLQLQNKTKYFGYDIWAAAGASLDTIKYEERFRQFEEYQSTTTFIKVFLGW